jgi:hypothetical protein
LELPKTIQHIESKLVKTKKALKDKESVLDANFTSYKQTKESEVIEPGEQTYTSLIEKFKNNYNITFAETKTKLGTGEKNRYKHANHVIDHLESIYNISRENTEKYIIYHMLDMLMLPEKIIILNHIYDDTRTKLTDPIEMKIELHIENYFNERKMEQSGRIAVILNKENGWKIFMKPDEFNESDNWEEGEPEDYKLFDKQLDRYVIDDEKINNIVGFVNMFKGREMVFKIKDVRQARNNTGARCGESTTRSESIKLLNNLLEKNVYDDSTEFMNFGLCVIIEILMRHFTDIQKNRKVFFLTPEETAVNDIVKFSKQ